MAEVNSARLVWQEGLRFRAETGSGHELILDSISQPGHGGPSPMEVLLVGVGGCTAIDVVSILSRMRQDVAGVEVTVAGTRADDHPKRYTVIELTYTVTGHGLSEEKVRRAVDLSHQKYCGASASLRTDCTLTSRIEVREVDER